MSLKSQPPREMPAKMARIGAELFPLESPYRLVGDQLYTKYHDEDYADLYGIPQQVHATRLEDQAQRWVERVFPSRPAARQAMERSKLTHVGESKRSKSTARRGRERSSAPCGQLAAQKRWRVGRAIYPGACEEKPSA
jgi:hypothetical protein